MRNLTAQLSEETNFHSPTHQSRHPIITERMQDLQHLQPKTRQFCHAVSPTLAAHVNVTVCQGVVSRAWFFILEGPPSAPRRTGRQAKQNNSSSDLSAACGVCSQISRVISSLDRGLVSVGSVMLAWSEGYTFPLPRRPTGAYCINVTSDTLIGLPPSSPANVVEAFPAHMTRLLMRPVCCADQHGPKKSTPKTKVCSRCQAWMQGRWTNVHVQACSAVAFS